jgi:hypothetical protein
MLTPHARRIFATEHRTLNERVAQRAYRGRLESYILGDGAEASQASTWYFHRGFDQGASALSIRCLTEDMQAIADQSIFD